MRRIKVGFRKTFWLEVSHPAVGFVFEQNCESQSESVNGMKWISSIKSIHFYSYSIVVCFCNGKEWNTMVVFEAIDLSRSRTLLWEELRLRIEWNGLCLRWSKQRWIVSSLSSVRRSSKSSPEEYPRKSMRGKRETSLPWSNLKNPQISLVSTSTLTFIRYISQYFIYKEKSFFECLL